MITNILEKQAGVAQPQKKFLVTLFLTILLMRGKVNFRNLSRYSELDEKTYSRQFRKSFDFVTFNELLIADMIPSDHEQIGVMDASFVDKSGKETYGLGFFYDSCHKKAAKGLETSNLAVIDVTANTGYTLSSWQTPPQEEIEILVADRKASENESEEEEDDDEKVSRVDFYAEHLQRDAAHLPEEVKYLVVDGYYAKSKFVKAARKTGLHIVGKLRHDANLNYLFKGKQKKQGRDRKYDGKVKFDDLSRFEYVGEVDEDIQLYTAEVYNVNLKCNIRLVYLLNSRNKKKPRYALLFSTDTELAAKSIYRYYKARFQIEFLFRDAKQFTGFNDCQARCQESLDFHFNASLTVLNLAKVDAYLSFDYDLDTPFSLATQKMVYFNDHLLQKVFSILDLDLSLINCQPDLAALRTYGAIAPPNFG
ncbi:MAG: transposase [Deltaproteobacteria bacterium]|nr:transposase [Deltaproteobacteria bacterium]